MAGCVLGALAAGVTIAPLDAGATAEELATRCDVLGLSAVVTDRDDDRLMARLAAGSSDVWGISGDGLHQLTGRRGPAGPPAVGDAAIILCGAATPGRPRVTTLSEADILGAAAAVVERHHIGPDDRGYSPLPLFQADGLVAGVFSNLVAGSTLILDRRFAAGRFWPTVQRHGATWVNLCPSDDLRAGRTSSTRPRPEHHRSLCPLDLGPAGIGHHRPVRAALCRAGLRDRRDGRASRSARCRSPR